jgi:hypothetical protein
VKKFPMPSSTTAHGGLTGFTLDGPFNSANVIASDIGSCKSYINVIDTVLMPFDPTQLTATNGSSASPLSAAIGAPACVIQGNSDINGTALNDGASNRQKSIGACCSSCQNSTGCNTFRYCALRGGCTTPDGTSYPFGWCLLQSSPEVASGKTPAYNAFGFDTPFVSGYVSSFGGVAAAAAGR